MPTIDSIFKKTSADDCTSSNKNKTITRRGHMPQERASYGAKRRQMDLDVSDYMYVDIMRIRLEYLISYARIWCIANL